MAQNAVNGQAESARERLVKPLELVARSIGLFADVATLMPRMLWNVLTHDTPHGKGEPAGEAAAAKKNR